MLGSSLSELARSVVCAGFSGTGTHDVPLDELRRLRPGAILLFARNVIDAAQLRALVSELREALGDPLVAVDQEGGRVARIRDGVTELPAMMALGATRDAELGRRAGARLGAELAGLGISVDFAPVMDLALDPHNTVIGNRAFGEDPELVAELGIAFARGLSDGGVVPVVKHFPGHGATAVDSHFALPALACDEAVWRARDAVPFRRAAAAGLPAIMTAHVVLPALDHSAPATLSPAIVGGILRAEWGYRGVVFSDCMEMDAIARSFGTAAAAPRALAAGVDCVLVSHRVELAHEVAAAIEDAVRSGELRRARLEEASARVGALRAAGRATAPSAGDPGGEIARRAVTVVLRGTLALPQGAAAITVVSFEEGEPPSLGAALRAHGLKAEIMRAALDPSAEDVSLLEMVLRGLSPRPIAIVMRRAHLHPRQAEAVARILAIAPDALVVSAREPYDAALFPQARNVACIYDDGAACIAAAAGAMAGTLVPSGSLPVRLDSIAVR